MSLYLVMSIHIWLSGVILKLDTIQCNMLVP